MCHTHAHTDTCTRTHTHAHTHTLIWLRCLKTALFKTMGKNVKFLNIKRAFLFHLEKNINCLLKNIIISPFALWEISTCIYTYLHKYTVFSLLHPVSACSLSEAVHVVCTCMCVFQAIQCQYAGCTCTCSSLYYMCRCLMF